MIRKFLTVTSFLMISTVCLNVNAMITEEQQKEQDEIIEQQFKVYVEIKNKQIDDYFSLFQGESEDFVPKKFTDKQVELLVAGKDGNGAEITINNKKIIIDKKTSEELYTYAPSSLQTWNPMRRLLHDRINFGVENEKSQDEKIKLVQQGSFGVPHIIEVTYTLVPKAFLNKLGSMTVRIEENNWEKDKTRKFITSYIKLFSSQKDQIKNLKKMLIEKKTIQEIADSTYDSLNKYAVTLMLSWFEGATSSKNYFKYKPDFDVIIQASSKGPSGFFLVGNFDESVRKFFAACVILFHNDEDKLSSIKERLEKGEEIQKIAISIYFDVYMTEEHEEEGLEESEKLFYAKENALIRKAKPYILELAK
jgi:hypothetical protein